MRQTPLDAWVTERTDGDLPRWQLAKLNETLQTAQHSPYYRERLPRSVTCLCDLARIPTIDARVLSEHGSSLVCVSQQEIARIVTLASSGTTGPPKRVYFTEDDQERTIDYFAHGLFTIAETGERMAILLPCARSGGVGDLIARALARMGVDAIPFGLVQDLGSAARMLCESGTRSLVGIPVQVRALARYMQANHISSRIRRVMLSTDNAPRTGVSLIRDAWNCDVFDHYGMTEMGLGGALECDAHDGAHVRENDLLFEILDDDGTPCPDGCWGEVAFTTLTRRAMPLIRYRTGDIARFVPGTCPCGSPLRRLSRIRARKNAPIRMSNGQTLDITAWDEALFALPTISDFTITADATQNAITLTVETQQSFGAPDPTDIMDALARANLAGSASIAVRVIVCDGQLSLHNGEKRAIALQTT